MSVTVLWHAIPQVKQASMKLIVDGYLAVDEKFLSWFSTFVTIIDNLNQVRTNIKRKYLLYILYLIPLK